MVCLTRDELCYSVVLPRLVQAYATKFLLHYIVAKAMLKKDQCKYLPDTCVWGVDSFFIIVSGDVLQDHNIKQF